MTIRTCTHELSNLQVSEDNVLPEALGCMMEVQSPPSASLGRQAQAGSVAVMRDTPGMVLTASERAEALCTSAEPL